ncbi:formin-like protein 14 [Durio zibethinus]|uniref:Formin-like protein 14 n=1 Tax=Durio zibethinus TaxID=66656 RepID=A0A6P5Z5M6_DURZI|nr:formin-like protein 14 [Durio zibethinus]
MSNSLQGAAAASANGAYPRDNFHGEGSKQISQSQGYPPTDDYLHFPHSSKQSLPSVQVLPPQQIPLKPLNMSQQSSQQQLPPVGALPLPQNHPKSSNNPPSLQTWGQSQQQQQLPSVGALPLPENPPKSNNNPPGFQTWDQPQQQERLNWVPSQGHSTKDNHDLQSHGSFNHPKHPQQQQPSPPDQVSLLKQSPRIIDRHPPTSQSTKDHLQSNQPRKQQPPIEPVLVYPDPSYYHYPPPTLSPTPPLPKDHEPVLVYPDPSCYHYPLPPPPPPTPPPPPPPPPSPPQRTVASYETVVHFSIK